MRLGIKQAQITEANIEKALESMPDRRLHFSGFEVAMIKKYVPTKGIAAVAKILGRTYRQVENKFYKLRLSE